MRLAFRTLPVVERARRGIVLHAHHRREEACPQQSAVVTSRPVVVAADFAGVSRSGRQAGNAGETIDGIEHGQIIACGREELGGQQRTKTGHRLQQLSRTTRFHPLNDLQIELPDAFLQCDHFAREPTDEISGYRLPRQRSLLTLLLLFRDADGSSVCARTATTSTRPPTTSPGTSSRSSSSPLVPDSCCTPPAAGADSPVHDHGGGVLPAQVIAIVGAAAAIAVYLLGAVRERSHRTWPAHRISSSRPRR